MGHLDDDRALHAPVERKMDRPHPPAPEHLPDFIALVERLADEVVIARGTLGDRLVGIHGRSLTGGQFSEQSAEPSARAPFGVPCVDPSGLLE